MRIKGLTVNYEYTVDELSKALMLRIANHEDPERMLRLIDEKMDHAKERLEENFIDKETYDDFYATLLYWKAKIYIEEMDEPYRNIWKIKNYLKKAFKAGSSDAAAYIGYCHYTGQYVTNNVDRKKAIFYFGKAKENYGLFVEYLIAQAIAQADNDVKSLRQAEEYYKIAIEKKVYGAKLGLVYLYLKLEENMDEAKRLLKEVSEADGNDYEDEFEEINRIQNSKKR